jgi:hypothetical protein
MFTCTRCLTPWSTTLYLLRWWHAIGMGMHCIRSVFGGLMSITDVWYSFGLPQMLPYSCKFVFVFCLPVFNLVR